MNNITLTTTDIWVSLTTGIVLCLIYFYLLWRTVQLVPKAKNPALLLFLSGAFRIFLLIFTALVMAQNNLARFLLIFCAFMLTRFLLLKITKPTLKTQLKKSEIVYHDEKPIVKKSTKKSTIKTQRKKKK